VTKFVAYAWSGARSLTGVRDQVWAALTAARQAGWDGLLAEQRQYLDDLWDRADVEVSGDTEVPQAVRFALFHVLQAGARAENRVIPAKGLTGPGYSGHAFWDTDTFVLPLLTFTTPAATASALRWRHSTLPLAIPLLGLMVVVSIPMVVDFPAPFGPSRPEHLARGDLEVDAVDSLDPAGVGLAQPGHFHGGPGPSPTACNRADMI
jgi:Glycosyl hydrolase family 65 central catalytic domain